MRRVGRNDPCPCGSGKKFKNCCGRKRIRMTSWKKGTIIVAVLVLVLGIGFVAGFFGTSGTKPPPGPAPPGKVWSPEHGHWHDAPGEGTSAAAGLFTQPPGPAPPGKVWSPEHGHWHDVQDVAAASTGQTVSQPATPSATTTAAEGEKPTPTVSSTQQKAPSIVTAPTTEVAPTAALIPQPTGPVPLGKVWSPEHGHWHNVGSPATSPAAGTTTTARRGP